MGIGVGETFWIYAAFNVGAFLFVYLRMPEFTGRNLEQIEGSLRTGDDLPPAAVQERLEEPQLRVRSPSRHRLRLALR